MPANSSDGSLLPAVYGFTIRSCANDRRRGSADLYVPPVVERLGLNRLNTWDLFSAESVATIQQFDPEFASSSPLNNPSPFSGDVVEALIDLRFLPEALDGQSATVNYSFSAMLLTTINSSSMPLMTSQVASMA